jgi:hypothetical protein
LPESIGRPTTETTDPADEQRDQQEHAHAGARAGRPRFVAARALRRVVARLVAGEEPAIMRGVPVPSARVTGLRALAGAGPWVLTGCGVIIDEPTYDTRAEQRPGTWVDRLQSEIGALQGAYEDMIVKATPPQRRRLPSIGSELSRLADAAASMKDDLSWRRGHFGEHLSKAESVATSIDQQLSGAPVTSAVRSHWWDTAYALEIVREFYRELGLLRLYEVQDDPRGSCGSAPPRRRRRSTMRRSRSARCGGATIR